MIYSASMLVVIFLIVLLLILFLISPNVFLYVADTFVNTKTSVLTAIIIVKLLFIILLAIETLLIYQIVVLIRSCSFKVSWTEKKENTMMQVPLIVLTATFIIIGLGTSGLFSKIHPVLDDKWMWTYGPYIIGAIGAIYLSVVLTDGNPKIK